jgi:hypothetical protein
VALLPDLATLLALLMSGAAANDVLENLAVAWAELLLAASAVASLILLASAIALLP